MKGKVNPIKLGYYRTTTLLRALLMLSVDIAGYVFLFPYVLFCRFKGLGFRSGVVSSIAVFRLDGIGDLVLSGPALKALRSAFPNAHITLFVNEWSAGLAELIDGPDSVIALKAPLFKAFKGTMKFGDVLDERRMLKAISKTRGFDLAIDLRGDFLSILTAWWLGARWLASRASRGGGFLLTNVISQPEEGRIREINLNINFVALLTGSKFVSEKARLKTMSDKIRKSMLEKMPQGVGEDYICLAVAAPYESRCYPVDKWGEVIRLIRKDFKKPILILGAAGDFEKCEYVANKAGVQVFNVAGKLTIVESAACIAGARMMIGNDGGLIHIASAFDRPVVQLFGPADPVCFGHHDEHEYVIHKECPYNPCPETKCITPETWCMNRINPAEVYQVAAPYLGSL